MSRKAEAGGDWNWLRSVLNVSQLPAFENQKKGSNGLGVWGHLGPAGSRAVPQWGKRGTLLNANSICLQLNVTGIRQKSHK